MITYNVFVSILAALVASAFVLWRLAIAEGWKIGLYPKKNYVGWRDFKVGLVLSGSLENLVPGHSRVTLTLGAGPVMFSIKIEIIRPHTKK